MSISTSKHFDKICISVTAFSLILTILFMFGGQLGLTVSAHTQKYESTLFDTSYVHQIDIVMNDWDTFIASCENEEYASCTVVVDGQKHTNIAIRAKGNTSLSNVSSLGSQRYSFKLEFDHYESGKTLDGLDKLCLNNLIQDNTMMKDYLVYQMMLSFGVEAPLCSYAYLTVNGEDWGLYLAVEGIEDSFLSRNYGSDTGDLYKPDSMSFGGGRGNGKSFNMDDFDFSDFDFAQAGADSTDGNTDGQTTAPVQPDTDGTESGSQSVPSMPSGQGGDFQSMPGMGDNQNGNGGMPQMPGQNGGTDAAMPDSGDFSGGEMPDVGDMELPDFSENGDFDITQIGGMSGMGSDDVKLQYIDDDPDSYSNIFDNAKTDVTDADKARLISALKNLNAYTDLEDTVDTDEVIRYFVIHNFVCNGDSYTGSMIHNYYLHENDGKLSMIPWDYNLAFGTFQGGSASSAVNASIDNPVSGGDVDDRPMLGWIFSDESYTETYHTLFAEFVEEWLTSGKLTTMISETAELLRPYVEKDPTKFCTTEEFEAGITAMTEFVTLRAQAVTQQLAGDTTAVDTGELNLSDMGTMNTGMGGGDAMGGGFEKPSRAEDDTAVEDSGTTATVTAAQNGFTVTPMAMTAGAEAANGTMPEGEMPTDGTMPEGEMPTDGTMPEGGMSTDGTIPENGTPDDMQKPDGTAEGTESAETASDDTETVGQETADTEAADGTVPENGMPDDMQKPDGAAEETESAETASDDMGESGQGTADARGGGMGNMPQMNGGDGTFEMPDMSDMPDMSGGGTAGTAQTTQWIYVGVSVLVLAVGLLIAKKFRY